MQRTDTSLPLGEGLQRELVHFGIETGLHGRRNRRPPFPQAAAIMAPWGGSSNRRSRSGQIGPCLKPGSAPLRDR